MRISLSALAILATAVAAPGAVALAQTTLTIPLPIGAADSVLSESYSCADGESFSVQYVNSGANALAILPVDGAERIFVNVVSASGARYVSGGYEWWTKGASATLQNLMEDGSGETCQLQETAPAE